MRRKDKDGGYVLREGQALAELAPLAILVVVIFAPFLIRKLYNEWRKR